MAVIAATSAQAILVAGWRSIVAANHDQSLVTNDQGRKNVLIVTQEAHAKGEAYHALLPYQALYEPVGRNTAPAIALAAAYLMTDGADPVMVVLPADHIIKDEVRFREHLDIAIKAAQSGKLVTFGIQPTRPDTGFGYIKAHRGEDAGVYAVERFTEKPDAATAERFP